MPGRSSHSVCQTRRKWQQDHRAIIITDPRMRACGHVGRLTKALVGHGYQVAVFSDVIPDPDMDCVRKGRACEMFEPDIMFCLGGGSPIDAPTILSPMQPYGQYLAFSRYPRDSFVRIHLTITAIGRLTRVVHDPTTQYTCSCLHSRICASDDNRRKASLRVTASPTSHRASPRLQQVLARRVLFFGEPVDAILISGSQKLLF